MRRVARVAKHWFDRASALVGLVVLAPFLPLVAAIVWISLGRPILFRQARAGLHGVPFRLIKLRTMRPGGGPDEGRLTRTGRFLRHWSLDELPGLWNVLVGEMSLVGPRPLPVEYLDRYSPRQARRHDARPGITGWAQVSGRNALSWDEKLERDVWYVENWSLALDARILGLTIWQVIRGRGISHNGFATMPEFHGTDPHR